MPYKLKGNCVVKADTGETVKCHDTHEQALAHLRALEVNVEDAKYLKSIKKTPDDIKQMMDMGGEAYARQECMDIAQAAAILSNVAYLCMNECDEPDDVQSLCNIMRSLMEFINGECQEMMTASKQGESYEKKAPAEAKTESPLKLSYVKSLHIEIPEDKLAVKFVGKDQIKGYAVLWGDANKVDLEREYFTKDTNFWDNRPQWLTWDHAQDETWKSDPRVGEILEVGDDEWGKWYIAKLKRAETYRKYLDDLIQRKSVGSSSDSAPQYVRRVKTGKSVWLAEWPLFAVSLTDTPCEPRMIGSLEFLKSLGIALPDVPSQEWKSYLAKRDFLKTKYLGD